MYFFIIIKNNFFTIVVKLPLHTLLVTQCSATQIKSTFFLLLFFKHYFIDQTHRSGQKYLIIIMFLYIYIFFYCTDKFSHTDQVKDWFVFT